MAIDIPFSDEPIALFGHAYARPGKEDELRTLLRSFVAPTRAEPGCLQYRLHLVPGQPRELAFYEAWQDTSSLEAHLAQPMVQGFLERRMTLLERDLEIEFVTPIEPIAPGP